MRTTLLGLALVAGFVMIAGAVSAQENEERPDDAAWVEDCPPDMMCAMSDPHAEDPCEECMTPPKDDENATRGDGSCEYCRGGEGDDNLSYGDEDCAHCSGASDGPTYDGNCGGEVCAYDAPEEPQDDGPTYDGNCGGEVCAYDADPDEPVSDDGASCMDGSATDCDDDVQYFGPPADDGRETANPEAQSGAAQDANRSVPGLGLIAAAGAVGAALAVLAPSRRK